MPMSERVLVEISVLLPASFPRRERRRGGRSAKPLVLYFEPLCDTTPRLPARRSDVGGSALGLIPRQDHAAGKRPGLHQVQVHPVVQGRKERRAAAHQDRCGDQHVLVDQPGPYGGRGECGAADVHGTAILSLEPGDLGDRVAGDQAGVPVDRAGRRGEHHLRHVAPAASELDLRRCGARLLVGGRPVGAHRLPQFAPVQRQARRPHPVGPPLEQLVARHAPAEVVAGRGDVAVQAQVHAKGQFPHGVTPRRGLEPGRLLYHEATIPSSNRIPVGGVSMQVWVRMTAMAAAVAATTLLGAAPALGADIGLRVLSNRADLVSGDDVLVEGTAPAGTSDSDLTLDVGGRDVTSAFTPQEGGRLVGLVDGLHLGVNVLTARAPDGSTSRLTITDNPIGGPLISGEQTPPWLCTTDTNGLGKATDAQCDAPSKVEYFYKSTDPSKSGLQSYDPAKPPSDVAQTKTDQGRTVPYIVRRERGALDRGVYDIAVLFDPKKPWTATAPQEQWNHKLYYVFGPSCSTTHSQNTPDDVLLDLPLSRGFMVANSSLNVLGNSCSTLVSAETAMMVKEHIADRYGSIRYTMGTGCSGGSIGQNVITNAYPGLVDGIQPACTYADNWTTGLEVDDCHLLLHYWTSSAGWSPNQQNAVDGHRDISDCEAWDATFASISDPRNGCGLPADQMYDPQKNPKGCRGTLQDFMIGAIGKRSPSVWTAPEKIAGGFAKSPFDNTGIQYGLNALNAGTITPGQFLDLNSKIGGVNIDFDFVGQRAVADEGALETLYRSGQVDDARQLDRVPIIDLQDWSESGEIHTSFHAWSLRARLDKANGQHDNQLIWTYPASAPILGVGPTDAIAEKSFLLLDKWLSRIEADKRDVPLEQKVVRDKPGDAVDGCFIGDQFVTDMGTCRATFPYYADARIAAGGPFTDDIGKCQLKPLDRSEYSVTFTDAQWAQLQQIFPTGVCDFTAPGVEQVPSQPWTSFAGGPGGRQLAAAPAAQALPAGRSRSGARAMRLSVRVGSRRHLRTLLRRGVRVRVRSSEATTLAAVLTVDRR